MKKLIVIAAMLAAAACSQSGTETATTTETAPAETAAADTAATATTATTETTAAATDTSATAKSEETNPMSNANKVAEIHTTAGQINIRFFPDVAPNHVQNFVDLASSGFYNGTKFHRVIPGFMIQGGDPNTKTNDVNTWGTGGSGKNLKAEFNNKPHKRGILSMARAQNPDSASSQFFIVVKDSNFLDGQYTVFGEVLSGMDVADKIVSAPRGPMDRPNSPVAIEKVVVRDANPGEI